MAASERQLANMESVDGVNRSGEYKSVDKIKRVSEPSGRWSEADI